MDENKKRPNLEMLGTNELPTDVEGGRILPINLVGEMKRSFISYAMAVIISRALPDVRDGLKPVHRRILYAMDELSMQPDKPFRKSARLVGDVLGKYHPHGDTAVYDAMVRLAQPFSTRYPLVEGHGNFGSVDGDPAAAMRYTEARMSRLTLEMLRDLDKNTVDFYPNFDETLMQPAVLPARYPNLLVNGSNGIAVGMATNIPPHNLGEAVDACAAMIDNPDITIDELMNYIPGPDFPTGGVIMGDVGIRHAYFTGRGKILVRAKSEIEQYKADRSRIIVTEIPYQVNKAKLVEKIAELVHEKRVDGISDLRDESSRAGMRIVIELKKDVNANVVLNNLYKHTQLQDTFGVIMIALVNGEPKVLNLREMLYHYIAHQKDVVTRRTQFDLDKARERLHILEGLMIALDNIDEVIAIIKASANGAEAKERLIARFGFSERQAQAILDMRLQRLTGLEREKLEAEYGELKRTVEYLASLLADEGKLMGVVKDEMLEIRRRFADPRRTEITKIVEDIDMDDIIQEGMIGLMAAIQRFDEKKECKFSTYAAQYINGYIRRSLPSERRIRLPNYLYNHYVKYKDMMTKIENGYLPEMSEEEQREYLEVTEFVYKQLRELRDDFLFLDNDMTDDDGKKSSFHEYIASSQEDPECIYIEKEKTEICDKLLSHLTEKERKIILFRMGFYGEPYTLTETGKCVGLSRERVRQIESKALKKMRNIKID